MMRHSQEFLDSIIFVDEASVEEKPTPDRVLTRRGEEALRTDSRLHPNKGKYEKIHFIEAVNGKLGFIDAVIASPTKGFTPKQQYVVSGQGGCYRGCRLQRKPCALVYHNSRWRCSCLAMQIALEIVSSQKCKSRECNRTSMNPCAHAAASFHRSLSRCSWAPTSRHCSSCVSASTSTYTFLNSPDSLRTRTAKSKGPKSWPNALSSVISGTPCLCCCSRAAAA